MKARLLLLLSLFSILSSCSHAPPSNEREPASMQNTDDNLQRWERRLNRESKGAKE